MTVPETQLERWSHQGAIAQSRATYASIRTALLSRTYGDKAANVFLQGSYGNDTNILAESDVDVVIETDTSFFRDLAELPQTQKNAYLAAHSNATYTYAQFKNDVITQLRASFGTAVVPGTKAVNIASSGNRRSADVLVAFEHRHYHRFVSLTDQTFDTGVGFLTSDGTLIGNYPQQHSDNCTAKHQATNSWFKPTVRILKNMRSKLADDGLIGDGIAPSYVIEGLLHNVPNDRFGGTYQDTVMNCINWVWNADRSRFLCANEKHLLLDGAPHVTWSSINCEAFLNGLRDLWTQG